jgi:uncharacterized membrane protein YfcA
MKTVALYQRPIYTLFFLTFGVYLMFAMQNTLHLQSVFLGHVNWPYYTAFFGILLLSSFVSGLSGFGFSAMGAALLLFLKPTSAVALLMLLSMFTQLLSFKKLWLELRPHMKTGTQPDSVLPYLIGGCLGVPLGVYFLTAADPKKLMMVLGGVLVVYAAYSLLMPKHWVLNAKPGWGSASLVGAAGGVIGGFSAFPGSAVVVWTGLQSMPKEQVRAITQPYIIAMQLISLAAFLVHDRSIFDSTLLALFVLALPVVYLGNSYGISHFKAMNQALFRQVTFGLLGLSGAMLLLKSAI